MYLNCLHNYILTNVIKLHINSVTNCLICFFTFLPPSGLDASGQILAVYPLCAPAEFLPVCLFLFKSPYLHNAQHALKERRHLGHKILRVFFFFNLSPKGKVFSIGLSII